MRRSSTTPPEPFQETYTPSTTTPPLRPWRSWRSSTTPPLPEKFYTFFPETYTPSTFPTPYSIYATDVYLLRPRRNPSKSFLVSVQQQPELVGKPLTVRHLLTNEAIPGVKSWPSDDWISVTRIIRSYGYDLPCRFCSEPFAAEHMKLAFTLTKSDCNNFKFVGLCQSKEYGTSRLVTFTMPKCNISEIKRIYNSLMVDIVKFKGEIYTVDVDGLLYEFDPTNSDLTRLIFDRLTEHHWSWSEVKRLVVSDGDLYMIVRRRAFENPVKCYRLISDPLTGILKWERVMDLGERVFFMNKVCSFSVSAKDLPPPWKGNTVVAVNSLFDWPLFSCTSSKCIKFSPGSTVYELGDGDDGGRCGRIHYTTIGGYNPC